ncbi:sigma-54-dependent Fis family transcriptional regulator [candidate division KSB1 bacterium]|nr:sigma-54-dependent Fis family transcriptional regulator [candidate division KSB1 bacterium]
MSQILKETNIAFGIFDQNLKLTKHSPNFASIIQSNTVKLHDELWEIFPELIGTEELVHNILIKKLNKYNLSRINKFDSSGDIHYYDLTIFPMSDKLYEGTHLLSMVADKTNETSLEQKIRQQFYEIEVLQANLSSYGNYHTGHLLGKSELINQVREFINKISVIPNVTILLQGESGTGKNMVAREIHRTSMDPKSPFVEINCASIPATLLESEIFGYEKGAFTDAKMSKRGLLEEAAGGTLFLDEIGELPLSLQAKFLSFLETKQFRRLGSTQERQVNIRIIAATNKDLKEAVDNKEFRQDLYFRVNVVNVKLPRLKELGDDILLIAQHYVNLFALDFRKKVDTLTEGAKKKLMNYSWPGNVRELRNVIERAVIFADEHIINEKEIILPDDKHNIDHATADELTIPDEGLSIAHMEKKLLQQALMKSGGNQTRAAKLLGLSLDTFRYRMKKYKLR